MDEPLDWIAESVESLVLFVGFCARASTFTRLTLVDYPLIALD